MALTPGTCLGPYEITAQIGVGGMGSVCRAIMTWAMMTAMCCDVSEPFRRTMPTVIILALLLVQPGSETGARRRLRAL